MKLEKIILFLGGAACIGAFFLPYLTFPPNLTVSGYSETMLILDYLDVVEDKKADILVDSFSTFYESFAGPKGKGILTMLVVVLLGPFFFAIFGLSYVIKALFGKQYKRGIFLNLLFMGFAWVTIYMINQEMTFNVLGLEVGTNLQFFRMAGLGYWLGFGGMILAAFSLFFGKTE